MWLPGANLVATLWQFDGFMMDFWWQMAGNLMTTWCQYDGKLIATCW